MVPLTLPQIDRVIGFTLSITEITPTQLRMPAWPSGRSYPRNVMPFPVPVRCFVSSRARLVAAAAARFDVVNVGVLPCLDRRRRAAADGAVFHDVVAGSDVRRGGIAPVGQGAPELALAFSFPPQV